MGTYTVSWLTIGMILQIFQAQLADDAGHI
jgi:hypothetical protein